MPVDVEIRARQNLRKLIYDLKGFEDRKIVLRELRKEIRKPVPKARKAIKAKALDTLPRHGGLNEWVASTRITASIRLSGRSTGVRLKGGRNSFKKRSDIRAIDKGRVRAPAWGHRTAWHLQAVRPGFFTETVAEDFLSEWRGAVATAAENAVEVLKRG
jgi:hypothetical protein